MNKHSAIFIWLLSLTIILSHSAESKSPVRFAIVGLSHDHARGFIPGARNRDDVQLVGIVEQDRELAARYAKNFKLSTNLFHASLEELIKKTNVQAVATFTSTFDHRRVVEECAAHGRKGSSGIGLKHKSPQSSAWREFQRSF